MNMYEVLNRTNCKRNAQLRTLRCVAWLVTAATQRNAQQRSTSNATQRNAQRSVCGHGPLYCSFHQQCNGRVASSRMCASNVEQFEQLL